MNVSIWGNFVQSFQWPETSIFVSANPHNVYVCICSYYVSWKAFANWRFFVYFTAQFIASVLDIPDFNLLCERVPYVRDDPRLTRVGNFLGTETRIIWNLTVTVS